MEDPVVVAVKFPEGGRGPCWTLLLVPVPALVVGVLQLSLLSLWREKQVRLHL